MAGLLTAKIAWQPYNVNHRITTVQLENAQNAQEQSHCGRSLKQPWEKMV